MFEIMRRTLVEFINRVEYELQLARDDDMQSLNDMMNSLMPVGGDSFGQNIKGPGRQSMSLMPCDNNVDDSISEMNLMMCNMNQMVNHLNRHSVGSSSVMSMTTGPDGKPQVYQASSSTRQTPGGICETKKTLCDSRSGVKKMSIGHHIGERCHVKEKEQNLFTGQLDENDEFINLEEEEEPQFSKEWRTKAREQFRPRNVHQAISYQHHQPFLHHRYNSELLALPPASSAESDGNNLKEVSRRRKKSHRSKPYDKHNGKPGRKKEEVF